MKGDMIATRKAFGMALAEYGDQYPNIVALDADLSCSTQTKIFADKFPKRFFNMGIAEQDMMSTATGLALCGKIAFASTFAMFAAGRAYEQIRNTVAYSNADVKVFGSHGGIAVGEDGSSHQALEDIALMIGLPNMRVVCPADAVEMRSVVKVAIDTPGPFYVRMTRQKLPVIFDEDYKFEVGKSAVVHDGSDVTIIAVGPMVIEALQAAEELKQQQVSARVINLSSIQPFDHETILKAAKETNAVVTAEDHWVRNGVGSMIANFLSKNHPTKMKYIGVRGFGRSGNSKDLYKKYGLTSKNITDICLEVLK